MLTKICDGTAKPTPAFDRDEGSFVNLLAPQVYEAALAALNGETLPKWIPSQESQFFMTDPNLKDVAAGRKY